MLVYIRQAADGTAAATLTLTKARLLGLLAGDTASPGIDIGGDPTTLQTLLGVLESGRSLLRHRHALAPAGRATPGRDLTCADMVAEFTRHG